jgi:hypothetical protein
MDALTTWDAAPAQGTSHNSTAAMPRPGPNSPAAPDLNKEGGTALGSSGGGLVEALTGALRSAALQEANEVLQVWGQQGAAAAALTGAGDGTGERTSRFSAPQVTLNDMSSRPSCAGPTASQQQQQALAPEAAAALRAADALARCGAVLHAVKELELADGPLRRALQVSSRRAPKGVCMPAQGMRSLP